MPPPLRPPGSGIPWIERFVARRILLPLGTRRVPFSATPAAMAAQARTLRSIASAFSPAQLTTRILIPPTRGLEDDSRFWSLCMVPDHLRRVNTRVVECLYALAQDRPIPDGPNAIVDFKPDPAADPSAFDAYERQHRDATAFFAAHPSPAPRGSFPHPWFGPLTSRQWAAFLPIHQSLHLEQARRIAQRLTR